MRKRSQRLWEKPFGWLKPSTKRTGHRPAPNSCSLTSGLSEILNCPFLISYRGLVWHWFCNETHLHILLSVPRDYLTTVVKMKTLATYTVFVTLCLGIMSAAVIPWPSTLFVVFGICESSGEYLAGECSRNTFNWKWCATEQFVRKMRRSECLANDGLIYYSEGQAQVVHERLKTGIVRRN